MKKLFSIPFLLLAMIFCYGQSSAQIYPHSAREFALGNSDIEETNDVTAMFSNPAALVLIENPAVALNVFQQKDGGLDENVAFPVSLSPDLAVGFSTDLLQRGYPGSRNAPADNRLIRWGGEVGAAALITPAISVGGAAGAQLGRAHNSSVWGTNFSAAIDYFPSEQFNYTVSVNNVGTGIMFDQPGSAIPTALPYDRAGSWQAGMQMKYPSSVTLMKPFLTFAFACEKFFDSSEIFYKEGIEILPISGVALRIGYIYGGTKGDLTTGIGLSFGQFELNYSLAPGNAPDITHADITQMMSLSFNPYLR